MILSSMLFIMSTLITYKSGVLISTLLSLLLVIIVSIIIIRRINNSFQDSRWRLPIILICIFILLNMIPFIVLALDYVVMMFLLALNVCEPT